MNVDKLDNPTLRSTAAKLVGEMIFEFSYLEFNLGLCVRGLISDVDVEVNNNKVNDLSVKDRVDKLKSEVMTKFAADQVGLDQFGKWFHKMERIRGLRNQIVHGRWASLEHAEVVVNVPAAMPGEGAIPEIRYKIADLENLLKSFKEVANELSEIRTRWRI